MGNGVLTSLGVQANVRQTLVSKLSIVSERIAKLKTNIYLRNVTMTFRLLPPRVQVCSFFLWKRREKNG